MKKYIALLSALILVLSFAACGSKSSDEAENLVIHIGEQTDSLFSYAVSLGIADEVLEGTNITYELTTYTSGPNMNDAYSSGDLDFATMGCQPALSGASGGRGYKIFARFYGQEHNSPLVATVDSGIGSIADLAGKRVGTYVGGTWQYYLSVYLAQAGLTEDDVDLYNTAAETATALRNGEIDAAVIGLTTAYVLEEEGTASIISNEPGTDSCNVITVRDGFSEEHPEATALIVEIYRRAIDAINEDNTVSYSQHVADKQGLDLDIVTRAEQANTFAFKLEDDDIASLSEMFDFMIENELVVEDGLPFEELFDLSLVD